MDSILPTGVQEVVQALGPVAGLWFAAKIILGFQRAVVDGAMERAAMLDERISSAEQRIGDLEDEVNSCDRRNAILVRTLITAGIDVPPEAMEHG